MTSTAVFEQVSDKQARHSTWQATYIVFHRPADFSPMESYQVYSFNSPADIQRFQVTTDRVLGGRSDCSFTLKQYSNFSAGVFQGVIDYEDGNPDSRGGFASFRTLPEERPRDLAAFEAFEMRVKADRRR